MVFGVAAVGDRHQDGLLVPVVEPPGKLTLDPGVARRPGTDEQQEVPALLHVRANEIEDLVVRFPRGAFRPAAGSARDTEIAAIYVELERAAVGRSHQLVLAEGFDEDFDVPDQGTVGVRGIAGESVVEEVARYVVLRNGRQRWPAPAASAQPEDASNPEPQQYQKTGERCELR